MRAAPARSNLRKDASVGYPVSSSFFLRTAGKIETRRRVSETGSSREGSVGGSAERRSGPDGG